MSITSIDDNQSFIHTQHFLLFAMPRSATHFTAVFFQKFFEALNLRYYIKFRTFRNFKLETEKLDAIHTANNHQASLLRITCPEETQGVEQCYGLEKLLSERKTLILAPRKDIEDLILARIIPFYHWSLTTFDGFLVNKNYYSFSDSKGTWSPYYREDIAALIDYYQQHKLAYNEAILEKISDVILDFAEWFSRSRHVIRKYDNFEISTDQLLISPHRESESICYGEQFPLLLHLNNLFNSNIKNITINNMKQQSKESKFLCFQEPEKIKKFIFSKLNSSWGQKMHKALYE